MLGQPPGDTNRSTRILKRSGGILWPGTQTPGWRTTIWRIFCPARAGLRKAIAEYMATLRSGRKMSRAQQFGNCPGRSGRIEEAIAEYREALRIKPYADAHYNWGRPGQPGQDRGGWRSTGPRSRSNRTMPRRTAIWERPWPVRAGSGSHRRIHGSLADSAGLCRGAPETWGLHWPPRQVCVAMPSTGRPCD